MFIELIELEQVPHFPANAFLPELAPLVLLVSAVAGICRLRSFAYWVFRGAPRKGSSHVEGCSPALGNVDS